MDEDKPQAPSVASRLREALAKRSSADRDALARRSAALTETVVAQSRVIEALTIEEAETSGFASELMDLASKLAESSDRAVDHLARAGDTIAETQWMLFDERDAHTREKREHEQAIATLKMMSATLEKKQRRVMFLMRACFVLVSEHAKMTRGEPARDFMARCFERAADIGDDCGYEEFMDEVLGEHPE